MKLFSLLLSLLLLLGGALRAEDFESRSLADSEGNSLPYRLLKPRNYDASRKYPLVLLLHGAGERGSDNAVQLKNGAPLFLKPEMRQKFPCFVVVPQVPADKKWVDMDWGSEHGTQPAAPTASMRLAITLLDLVEEEFSIDADRVYLTGISMGGFGTWDAISRWSGKFAAAVPICGGGDPAKIVAAAQLPIWAFHGGADNVVKTSRTRELVAALKAAGGAPLYSEYPGTSHDSWTNAYSEPELLPWLFAQKRGATPVAFEKAAQPFAQPPSETFPFAGPVQPGVWFRGLWKERRTEWAKSTPADQGAVVFFGDSITQGWGSLAQDFPNLKVANRGISGDTTRGLLYRISGDVLALKPKAVSLLIGTNDLSMGAAPELVAANIREIVARFHAADSAMPIILNKVMPRAPKAGLFPEKIEQLNALLTDSFKSDAKVTFCDTWSLFDDGAGASKKEEFPDMLHPNADGYAKWSAALAPLFESLIGH